VDTVRGQEKLALAGLVARRFYLEDRSKIEIAEELGLSRFQVARLLEAARSSGQVRIEIRDPGGIDVELSRRVQTEFSLAHSIVIDAPEDDDVQLRRYLGEVCAALLTEIVTPGDVLGLGWARAVLAMRNALARLAPCTVVQLTGALTRPDVDESSVELVRAVARVAQGSAYCFYAPMFVGDAATAAALLRQPEIARATKLFGGVTKAVVGVGGWDPPHSTVYDALSGPERQELLDLGTRADLSGVLLDANGDAVGGSFTDRVIGIRAVQLRRIPDVIAIAYGAAKAPAASAAIRGGYVNSLVTHVSFAKALLQNTGPEIGGGHDQG
jgi:DNA-binding transcriptional regulator LsrR (DeoR family)